MKRTLFVLMILAGLGAYVYFVEVKGKQAEEKAEKAAKRLVPIDKIDVERLEIVNAGKRMAVAKVDGKWQMTHPVSAPADTSVVDAVLSSLTGAETKGSVTPEGDSLRAYGLHDPKLFFTVASADKTVKITVGRKSPVSQDTYVKIDDQPEILLTSTTLEATGNRKPDDLRDKQLFTFAAGDVTAVTVKDGAATVVVRRHGDGWLLESPAKLEADASVADGLASDIANLRAAGWIAETATPAELAANGLAKPAVVIEAELKTGERKRIFVGAAAGNDRAARIEGRPQILKIADWSVKNLTKTPADLKDRRLFKVDPAAIARLTFRSGDTGVDFRRQGAGWSVEANASTPGNTEKIDGLVTALVDLRATEWSAATKAALQAKKLAPPLRTVTAYDASGKTLATLKFGSEDDGWAIWAQTDDATMVAKAPNEFVKNQWPDSPEAFYAGATTGNAN